jgi:hypothetical protein
MEGSKGIEGYGRKDLDEDMPFLAVSSCPRLLDATLSGARVVAGAAAGVEVRAEDRIAARKHHEVRR